MSTNNKMDEMIILTEQVDMTALQTIITNFNALKEHFEKEPDENGEESKYDVNTLKNILLKYFKLKKKKGNDITYGFVGEIKDGRMFSKGDCSLQSLKKKIRHTLAKDIYYDIDMKNAHPTILSQYCAKNEILCPMLDDYVFDRDNIVNSLIKVYPDVSFDDMKKLILTIINGGGGLEKPAMNDWLLKFFYEMKEVRQQVCKKNPNLVKRAKNRKEYNIEGTATNYLLCIFENEILQSIRAYCKSVDIKVGALVFDGLMIYKKHEKGEYDVKEVCQKASEWVGLKTGWFIDLVEKPMNKGLDLTEYSINGDEEIDDDDDDDVSWVKELMFNLNDLNCAVKFKEYNEGEIFYTESHRWIIFNKKTKFWSFNNNEKSLVYHVSKFFSDAFKKYQIEFTKNYDPKNKDEEELLQMIMKTHRKVGMTKFANGVISQLQAVVSEDCEIMERFDMKPNLIAFKNGQVIDLERNGKVRDILKDDYIITHTGYDLPNRDDNDIELVKEILNSIVKTKDDLKVVLTALSCNLYGKNKNELFYLFTGSGGNGKGLLDSWLFSLLGNYYKTINITQLTTYEKDGNRANSELTKCHYARCVMTSEPDNNRGTKLITPIIKKWTGNDLLTTRELHGKSFQFCPRFTLSIQCNGIPDLSVDDGGIRRRMKCIELPFKFVANNGQPLGPDEKYADDSLKEKVKTSSYRNAMLFILIDTWIENNGKFYENIKTKEFTNSYFDSQNPVKLWFNENYEVDENGRTASNTMLDEYRTTTEDFDMTTTTFGKLMKEFCKSIRSGGTKYMCKKKEEIEVENEECDLHHRLLPRNK